MFLILLAIVASLSPIAAPAARSTPVSPQAERARVQAHLAGAEAQLRAADTSALSPHQRARRALVVAELARYRERGVFPRNLDFAAMTPYFVDDHGVRCAMAHLIETFGGAELVARVAAEANNARVAELANDPDLLAWLDAHGMTVAEAARVQPSYRSAVGGPCALDEHCVSDRCIDAPGGPPGWRHCTEACDPAASQCPVALWDVPMTCASVGGENLCAYPGPFPGSEGWSCDVTPAPEQWRCFGLLVCFDADPAAERGVCTPTCSTDAECTAGTACIPSHHDPYAWVCQSVPPGDGCSVGGGPHACGALAFVAALGLAVRRRRGRGRGR